MKKILVIGSTVVDVIINVDKLPTTKGDVHVQSQHTSMGGCAYNVSDIIRHFGVPYTLFSPVGTGIYGDYVRKNLLQNNISVPNLKTDMPNGCCYCFVEESGERTFISNHGAEYLIYKPWLDEIETEEVWGIYICGLEIEEKTGTDIVEFLEEHRGIPVFFAPGPRINRISEGLLARIFALSPIMHLNDDEICEYTKQESVEQAIFRLYEKTGNIVIVTAGGDGAYYYDKNEIVHISSVKAAKIVDTIGAGDSHIGAVMSCLYKGEDIYSAVQKANAVASGVVSTKGALLSSEEFNRIK